MKNLKEILNTYCEEYWWNGGRKTLYFKGELKDLLKKHQIRYTIKKTEDKCLYIFTFKNDYGITFKTRGLMSDFAHTAKQFIQMELCRMGDKSTLYVQGVWRPTVTINH